MSDNRDSERTAALDSTRREFVKAAGTATALAALSAGATGAAADGSEAVNIDDLVDQMTLEEKVSRTVCSNRYIDSVERSNVPGIRNVNGPAGASLDDFIDGAETTEFPHAIGAAATFNPDLINEQGRVIAREVKDGDAMGLFAPSIDIVRVPLHSRSGETFGEDPYLAGELTRNIVNGLQSEGVIATLKHFCAYNQTRTTGDVEDYYSTSEHNVVVDERALREIYLTPFRVGITDGNAGAVMTAYNRINGRFASEHDFLLNDILKEEWGFDGYVISDYRGTHSTVRAAISGLDVELTGEDGEYFGDNLVEAVENNDLNEDVLNEMVVRTLRSQRDIGALSGDRLGSEPERATKAHLEISEQVASEGTVLLKNEDLLPLDTDELDEIALVGPTPASFKEDTGGTDGINETRNVSLVDGLKAVTDDNVTITTVPSDRSELVPADDGFSYEYYDKSFDGEPDETGTVAEIDYNGDAAAAVWEGEITPDSSGSYGFMLASLGESTLFIDGTPVVDNLGGGFSGPDTERSSMHLEAGRTYELRVEVRGGAPVRVEWNPPTGIDEAAAAAADADVALILARSYTNYGDDRKQFDLPGNQNALVERVGAANDDAAVLLNTESPVAMSWVNDVPAIVQLWFPGQEGGRAVADLLVGNANPSGKVPVTFAESVEDYLPHEIETLPDAARGYPGVDGDVYYDEGVFIGYRHFDEHDIEPLFPFGHGESYTTFEYGKTRLSRAATIPEQGLTVSVDVTNTGDMDGAEAIQVYVSDVDPAIERPSKELKGISKLEIPAGETRTVSIDLEADAFQYWDPDGEEWTVNYGKFEILVGSSSRDIRDTRTVRVREQKAKGRSQK